MIEKLKKQALKRAGSLMGSPAALSVLSNPTFQGALTKAINLRSDVRDSWERQLEVMAKSFNLVTRGDVKALKRRVRELENQVATLEHELKQTRLRAEKAEKALAAETRAPAKKSEPNKSARPAKAEAKTKAAPKPAAPTKAKKAEASKPAAKKPAAKQATPAKKKAAPAKKKAAKK